MQTIQCVNNKRGPLLLCVSVLDERLANNTSTFHCRGVSPLLGWRLTSDTDVWVWDFSGRSRPWRNVRCRPGFPPGAVCRQECVCVRPSVARRATVWAVRCSSAAAGGSSDTFDSSICFLRSEMRRHDPFLKVSKQVQFQWRRFQTSDLQHQQRRTSSSSSLSSLNGERHLLLRCNAATYCAEV